LKCIGNEFQEYNVVYAYTTPNKSVHFIRNFTTTFPQFTEPTQEIDVIIEPDKTTIQSSGDVDVIQLTQHNETFFKVYYLPKGNHEIPLLEYPSELAQLLSAPRNLEKIVTAYTLDDNITDHLGLYRLVRDQTFSIYEYLNSSVNRITTIYE
jgi:hypothetical protein